MRAFVTKAEIDQLVRDAVKDHLAFELPAAVGTAIAAASRQAIRAAEEAKERLALERANSARASGNSCASCRFVVQERELVFASFPYRDPSYYTTWKCRKTPLSIPVRESHWCGEWTATGRAK